VHITPTPHLPEAPATNTVRPTLCSLSSARAAAAAAASSCMPPMVPTVPHTSSRARALRVVVATRCTGRVSAAAAARVEQHALRSGVVADGLRCHRATPRTPRARATIVCLLWAAQTTSGRCGGAHGELLHRTRRRQTASSSMAASPSLLETDANACASRRGARSWFKAYLQRRMPEARKWTLRLT